ncbi:Protein of unknown function, partial [Gryllus bimaculatus]
MCCGPDAEHVWFSNRRARLRKQLSSSASSYGSMALPGSYPATSYMLPQGLPDSFASTSAAQACSHSPPPARHQELANGAVSAAAAALQGLSGHFGHNGRPSTDYPAPKAAAAAAEAVGRYGPRDLHSRAMQPYCDMGGGEGVYSLYYPNRNMNAHGLDKSAKFHSTFSKFPEVFPVSDHHSAALYSTHHHQATAMLPAMGGPPTSYATPLPSQMPCMGAASGGAHQLGQSVSPNMAGGYAAPPASAHQVPPGSLALVGP